MLVLAHLRNADTYPRLAASFGVGTSTAWRYTRETADLLATLADDVNAAVLRAGLLAYVILDGTLIPIDRLADERPYYSGNTAVTASTCRSWPIPPTSSSGPRPRCPVPRTT
ncbi:hypothetical protein Nocox_09365 [Nonomuraea coxensis DSM 45129]|uniref:Transposase Helix-turn-helix domain-containing protein n=1 Tax=Nonomuraea coxensis DSM 45129 TaxID=1122611 RepID=A0ABX8TYP6_9ACTN|nr:hypothetical protein Nocox_09365 [Nonomuraea coxensis DSM 45129]